MSNASGNSGAPGKHERVGPDYFGYYSSEVASLLSLDEDALPVATPLFEIPRNKCGEGGENSSMNHNDDSFGPLFSNGVGAGLSDLQKDRLRLLLRQSATNLSSEVDEVVDPVLAIYQFQCKLKCKTLPLDHRAFSSDAVHIPCKKAKVSSADLHKQTSDANPTGIKKSNDSYLGSDIGTEMENGEVNDDLQFLLENDSVEVREMVKQYSNELSGTLEYMEQQLEMLLDTVMSKCRPMTLSEKQQLQRLIQKLPAGNLDRIANIICRKRPMEGPISDEIFVDLEKEDNVTLWRLYYYVEAVEKAKKLGCTKEV